MGDDRKQDAEKVRDLAAMVKHCTDRAAGCEDEGNRYLEQATRMFKAAGAWQIGFALDTAILALLEIAQRDGDGQHGE